MTSSWLTRGLEASPSPGPADTGKTDVHNDGTFYAKMTRSLLRPSGSAADSGWHSGAGPGARRGSLRILLMLFMHAASESIDH